MRTLMLLFVITVLLASCRTIPSEQELLAIPSTYTNRDPGAKFGDYGTFFISDTIVLMDDEHPNDTVLTGGTATSIINTVRQNMISRGYQAEKLSDQPDLGISLTLLKNQEVESYYYPGYWYGYWGYGWYYPYYPYYYPYTVTIPYNSGTLIIDMVDLKHANEAEKLVVIWNAIMSGLVNSSSSLNEQAATGAINQAFTQSPYITTN